MPGKVDHSAQLSKASLLALRAEQQEGVKKHSFWDKWSNLTTGQKWGRALAWIPILPGIALQIKASIWQSRQAKVAGARPQESKVNQSRESLNGIPLRSKIVFGKEHRDIIKNGFAIDLNNPAASRIQPGDSKYSPQMAGLSKQFALDLTRDPNLGLRSHDGKIVVNIGKDTPERAETFRDFFQQTFPEDSAKADQWAVFSSKFLNQHSSHGIMEASSAATTQPPQRGYFIPLSQAAFKLQMEAGGNSALIELRSQGKPNNWPEVDVENSRVDHFVLMRVSLGPPENLEVLSSHSNHKLVPQGSNRPASVENPEPNQGGDNEPLDKASAANLLRQFAQGAFNPGSDRYHKLAQYKSHLATQEPPDFAAFVDAYSQLDTSEEKQKLIGELAVIIKDREQVAYMNLMGDADEVDPQLKIQMQSEPRIRQDYPLSTQSALNPEKGPIISNSRDLDIQNFVHRKFEEEIAQKHLAIKPEEFYQIIKEGMGPEGILTTGYLNKKNLPPHLGDLRTNLKQDFEKATTLDDFYKRAENTIATARQNAPESIQNSDIQEVQPTVVRGAVSSLVLNSNSTTPAEMKSLAADLKKSPSSEVSFQIDVLKDHSATLENWASRMIDSSNDPEALRKERDSYTRDTGRATRTFQIEKEDGSFENIQFGIGVSQVPAEKLEQKLETALKENTSFQKAEDFLNLTQGFLHQGAFAAIFSGTAGATGLTLSDFTRTEDKPSFNVTLHRNGQIHIEGRMEMSPSAIDQDSVYVDLDPKQSSLTQSFQVALKPTLLDGQTKVDCELREAESKGSLHRSNGNRAN